MRVPLGNFGDVVAQAGPAADTSAVGAALERAGATLGRIEDDRRQRRQAVERVKAYNALQDRDLAIKAKREELRDAVRSGKVDDATARSELEGFLQGALPPLKSGIRLPDLDTQALDPETREAVEGAKRAQRTRSLLDFDGELEGLVSERAAAEGDRAFGALADRAAEGEDPAVLEQSAGAIASGLAAAGLAPEAINEARERATRRTWRAHVDRRAQAGRNSLDELRALQRDLTAGDGPLAGKLSAEDRSVLTRQVNADIDRLEAARERAAAERARAAAQQAEADTIEELLQGGELLDPRDDRHRDYVGSLFEGLTGSVERGSTEWQDAAIAVAARTGIVPRQVQSWLRGSSMGTGMQQGEAARVVGALAATNPQLLEFVDPQTKEFGLLVTELVNSGADPLQAVATVREGLRRPPNERELLQQQYRGQAGDVAKTLRGLLADDDQYDRSVLEWGAPDAPAAMIADFNTLAAQYYVRSGGNLALAQRAAYRDLQTRWGRTDVNGKREIVRYPVERFGVPAAYVRSELVELYGAERAKNIRLIADAGTERRSVDPETGRLMPVSWAVVEVDPATGETTVLPRWDLPTPDELESVIRQRRDEAVNRAKARAAEDEARAAQLVDEARRIPIGSAAQLDRRDLRFMQRNPLVVPSAKPMHQEPR